MLRQSWKTASFLVLTTLALASVPQVHAQVGVVTLKSIDDLMSDVRYLLTLAGQKERADQLDGLLIALTNGNGLKGIDTKRPLGVYANAPATVEGIPTLVGFVPITKKEEFFDFLKQVNITTGKDGDFDTLEGFGSPKLFVRFENQCAYISNEKESLKGKLTDPTKLIPTAASATSLISASARIDQIPAALKKEFLKELEKGIAEEKNKKDGESEAEYQGRIAGATMAKNAFVQLVEDSREVTLSFEIDQRKNNLALDLALIAKDGTKMADQIKVFGSARSIFSNAVKDSAFSLLVHLPIAEDLRNQFAKLMDQAFKEGLSKQENVGAKLWATRLFKALEPTLKGEVLDFAAGLQGPNEDKTYVGIAGLKVKEGKKIEQLARDIVKEFPADDKHKVTFDFLQHNGVPIHRLQVEAKDLDEKARKIFGAAEIFVVIKEDLMLVTLGQKGLAAMQQALDALAKPPDAATQPIQLEFSIRRLAPLADENQEKIAAAIRKVFTGADQDKDKVRISLQGGSALRLRLDVNAEIVKFAVAISPLGEGQ